MLKFTIVMGLSLFVFSCKSKPESDSSLSMHRSEVSSAAESPSESQAEPIQPENIEKIIILSNTESSGLNLTEEEKQKDLEQKQKDLETSVIIGSGAAGGAVVAIITAVLGVRAHNKRVGGGGG